jgi:hypothetical protein
MAEQPSTSLVSDAEIEAALADARTEEIPSLDDTAAARIVPVAVQGPALRPMPPLEPAREPAADAQKPPAKVAPTAVAPRISARVGGLFYRAVDTLLWAINRPFGWLPLGARRLAGAIAIVTLLMSLLAPCVLPLLSSPQKAVARTRSVPSNSVERGPTGGHAAPKH